MGKIVHESDRDCTGNNSRNHVSNYCAQRFLTRPPSRRMFASRTNIILVVTSWTLCNFACAAITFLMQRMSTVRGEDIPWEAWAIWNAPLWLFAGAVLFFSPRTWLQTTVVVLTFILVPMTVLACYSQTQIMIDMHNARAAGRRMMVCGPPLELCALVPSFLLSFLSFLFSLMQLHSRLTDVGKESKS
jgi:hypothetical protein